MAHFFMTWHAQALPGYVLPEGYALRTYRPGDEADWLRFCNGGGLGTESWTAQDFAREMLGKPGVTPERIFFAVDAQGRIGATATAVCQPDQGYVHMVAADSAYRGKTLGKAVCHAVMQYLTACGYDKIVLETDDWREPAIRVYEWLGFTRDEAAEEKQTEEK